MEHNQTKQWRWWLILTIIAQVGWGAYPVFLRYLQTVSQIPSLSLLAVANGLMFWSLYKRKMPKQKSNGKNNRKCRAATD